MAAKPTWAKKATAFTPDCRDREDRHLCKPLRIPSPDGKNIVEVYYENEKDGMRFGYLRLISPGYPPRVTAAPASNGDVELLWAPDSKAFFINGGWGSAISGFYVYVYRVDTPEFEALDITHKAMLDMVKSFPPCKALMADAADCKKMETDPEYYNMTGIDWADSSSIIVMSEVLCSSRVGGIMCRIMGYQLAVPSGKILARITARELKQKWQKSMAWQLRIPEPAEYEPKPDKKHEK
jgi:hypothetical protein